MFDNPGSTRSELPSELEDRLYEVLLGEDLDVPARTVALEQLLAQHPEHDAAIRHLAARLARGAMAFGGVRERLEEETPERIGDYRILETIGSGGFGIVYRAEQEKPVRRTVALKLLQAGALNEKSLLRFEAEAQVLARMQHAAIAQVYDAGESEDGRPYFAMEFVDGTPVTTFCDRQGLDVRQRLDLFRLVCAGVTHAHQKGVLHRDLKPSNVLVGVQDGAPVPKVIDFGVAKALDPAESHVPFATIDGGLVGTPEYMSPEQAAGRAVDTRTDVYALGVLLYELLTGQLPFGRERFRTASVAGIVKIVTEEVPRRSSSALRESGDLGEVAQARRSTPEELMAALRDDLDWVLVKALEKDVDVRYGSVELLAADVSRYLDGQPVEARRQAAMYVARKFAARHRVAVSIAAFVLLVIGLGIAFLVWGLVEIQAARDEVVAQRDDARARAYAARIATAQLSHEAGDMGTAIDNLRAAEQELRGWEWRFLASRCDQSLRTIRVRPMRDVLWTRDGEHLVAGGYGEGVDLIRADSGAVVRRITNYEAIREMAVHHASGRLILALDRGVEVWDLAGERDEVVIFKGDPAARSLVALAVSPDSGRVAFARARDFTMLVGIDGSDLRDLSAVLPRPSALAFDADGSHLLCGTEVGGIQALDVKTRQIVWEIEGTGSAIDAMVLDHAGKRLFLGHRDGELRVLEPETRRVRRISESRTRDRILRLAVAPDDTRLYVAGGFMESVFEVFDLGSYERLGFLLGHTAGVEGLDVSPQGRVATGSRDGTIRLWPSIPPQAATIAAAPRGTYASALSEDGTTLYLAPRTGGLRAWSLGAPAPRPELVAEPHVFGMLLCRGEFAIGVSIDKHLRRVRLRDGALMGDAEIGDHPMRLAVDEAGRRVAVSTYGDVVRVYEVGSDLRETMLVEDCRTPAGLAFSPDGSTLLVAGLDGLIRFLDPSTGRQWAEVGATPTSVSGIAWGGDVIAVTHGDGWLDLIDAQARTIRWSLRGHEGYILASCVSRDGTRLATSGLDRKLRLWDTEYGAQLLLMPFVQGGPADLRFDTSGQRLGAVVGPGGSSGAVQFAAPPEVELPVRR